MSCATRSTKGPSTSVVADPTDEVNQDETSLHEESEPEQEIFTHNPQPDMHQPAYTNMYVPYNDSPKMDWMVNEALYHRFLEWKLKCENILECELAALPECQKCKKVITWSGNFGMDQYISWGLSKEEMNLDTILERLEDFCKLQFNEVRAQFDLLTSFCQGNKSIDEWYNAVQEQVNFAKYPQNSKNVTFRYFLVLIWWRFCV